MADVTSVTWTLVPQSMFKSQWAKLKFNCVQLLISFTGHRKISLAKLKLITATVVKLVKFVVFSFFFCDNESVYKLKIRYLSFRFCGTMN